MDKPRRNGRAVTPNQIALVFNAAGSLTNRILSGPAVDQVLADEQLANELIWPLPDNLGTRRDIVDNDGDVLNHISYDSFGNRVAETNSAVDHIFGWTSREFDEETGLQYNRARYYDSTVGRWISEDPIGFSAGDANLTRYVGNSPVNSTDPFGLEEYEATPNWDPVLGNILHPDGTPDSNLEIPGDFPQDPTSGWEEGLPGNDGEDGGAPGDDGGWEPPAPGEDGPPDGAFPGVFDDVINEFKKLRDIFNVDKVIPKDSPKKSKISIKPKPGQPGAPPPRPIGNSGIVDTWRSYLKTHKNKPAACAAILRAIALAQRNGNKAAVEHLNIIYNQFCL